MQTLEALLASSRFFQGLTRADLELIAGCGSHVEFKAGEFLFHEGDPSDRFYLINRGTVALEVASPGHGALTVSTLGEDELIGWSWLVPPYRTQSDARAIEPTRATSFDGACIRMKCEEDPRLGYALLKRFAQLIERRLQDAQQQLLVIHGTPIRDRAPRGSRPVAF